ncbi:MAG: substrate-binding domain-containing protein, partial [Chloroflexota bacterium]|nr:substrate-binding domain-containing protein [Chloroflexota bacterium]
EQLSVVGFDDIPMAAYAVPWLTRVRQRSKQLARLAVDDVLELLGKPTTNSTKRIVQPELIQRDSCARPP